MVTEAAAAKLNALNTHTYSYFTADNGSTLAVHPEHPGARPWQCAVPSLLLTVRHAWHTAQYSTECRQWGMRPITVCGGNIGRSASGHLFGAVTGLSTQEALCCSDHCCRLYLQRSRRTCPPLNTHQLLAHQGCIAGHPVLMAAHHVLVQETGPACIVCLWCMHINLHNMYGTM
jgi:hypothetical protein